MTTVDQVCQVLTNRYGGIVPPKNPSKPRKGEARNASVRPMTVYLLRTEVVVDGEPLKWAKVAKVVGLSDSGARAAYKAMLRDMQPNHKPFMKSFIEEIQAELRSM